MLPLSCDAAPQGLNAELDSMSAPRDTLVEEQRFYEIMS